MWFPKTTLDQVFFLPKAIVQKSITTRFAYEKLDTRHSTCISEPLPFRQHADRKRLLEGLQSSVQGWGWVMRSGN